VPVRVWPRAPITLTVLHCAHSGWATNERNDMPRKPKAVAASTGPLVAETIEEYLARGGKITVCEPGARSDEVEYKFKYGAARKKKKKKDE
jgi:hypothetical protein